MTRESLDVSEGHAWDFPPILATVAHMEDEFFLSPFAAHNVEVDDLIAGFDADDIDGLL